MHLLEYTFSLLYLEFHKQFGEIYRDKGRWRYIGNVFAKELIVLFFFYASGVYSKNLYLVFQVACLIIIFQRRIFVFLIDF